jgi:hypothetical protein
MSTKKGHIKKVVLVCKGEMKIASSGSGISPIFFKNPNNHPYVSLSGEKFITLFKKGNSYSIEYEDWYKDKEKNNEMIMRNNGHRKYWATGEFDEKRLLSRSEFEIVFGRLNLSEIRNCNIIEILKND